MRSEGSPAQLFWSQSEETAEEIVVGVSGGGGETVGVEWDEGAGAVMVKHLQVRVDLCLEGLQSEFASFRD
jgi:hypothetical protein